jgi:methionyl-tRNA formyltransferase
VIRSILVGSKAIAISAASFLAAGTDLIRVITVDDSADGRSELADLRGNYPCDVIGNPDEVNSLLASLDADLILVAGWYWRISSAITQRKRIVGIHHSLLPKYRGGSPLVWALMNGDEIGTSLFSLTGEMDAGVIWGQQKVDQGDGYIGEALERCNEAAIQLLPRLLDPKSKPIEQDHSAATWCLARQEQDGKIDWSQPATVVVRAIRAQSHPYPGAFTMSEGQQVRIWRASRPGITYFGPPGRVIGDLVICGDNEPVLVEDASQPLTGLLA